MYQGLLIAMQTLGLQNMQFLDMGAGGGPPDRTRRVYHRTDELLIQQNVDVPLSVSHPVFDRNRWAPKQTPTI